MDCSKNKKTILYDASLRCTIQNGIYGFQRRELLKRLKSSFLKTVDYSIDPRGKKYRKEIFNSFSTISPFGYGEICIRDFEAFVLGSLLVKPSMDHIDTYPNWYINKETYISIQWDFSDLEDLFSDIRDHKEELNNITINARKLFEDYRNSKKRKKEFVCHVIKTINEEVNL